MAGLPSADERLPSAGRVRFRVLAAVGVLAYLTYINRLGFGVAAPSIKADLGLGDEGVSYLAAAFMLAYGLCQIPGGLLGDRVGSRHLLTVLVLGWSLLSGLTALAAGIPGDSVLAVAGGLSLPLVYLILLRFLFGFFQAAEFPSLSRVVGDWVPIQERGLAQGLVWTCSRLGGATVPFLFAGMLLLFGTWTTPFWVMAASGALWCAFFWPWFRNRPEQMAGVTAEECRLIRAGRENTPVRSGPFPWRRFLGCGNVWALCLMNVLAGFSGNFYTSMLPLYLKDHRHLDGLALSTVTALPLACGIVTCLLGGVFSDWLIRGWGSRKWARRVPGMIGLAGAGALTLLIPHTGDVWLLGLVVGLAFAFSDLNMGPSWAACVDVGERYAGTVSGAMNMAGAFAGAMGAALAGRLLGQPQWLFLVFACSYVLAGVCWLLIDVSRPAMSVAEELPAPPWDPVEAAELALPAMHPGGFTR
jgi:sugar phosphate permease